MNTLDKQKFNQYRKVKFYIAVCFWIFSLSMFAGGSRKAVSENKSGEKKISGNRVEDEAIKIEINEDNGKKKKKMKIWKKQMMKMGI